MLPLRRRKCHVLTGKPVCSRIYTAVRFAGSLSSTTLFGTVVVSELFMDGIVVNIKELFIWRRG